MLVGFGCHCQYSLTAMNWLENSGSCVNTRLSFLNTGQQVTVFHSKLCPNLHTNHWSYLEVPSRALTKCTGCTGWVFQTCQHHLAYHSCERGHNMWPSNCQWLCDFTVHGVCEGVHRCLRVFMYMCVCVRVCCVVRMLCVLCMCVTCTYDIGCGGEFPQTTLYLLDFDLASSTIVPISTQAITPYQALILTSTFVTYTEECLVKLIMWYEIPGWWVDVWRSGTFLSYTAVRQLSDVDHSVAAWSIVEIGSSFSGNVQGLPPSPYCK